MREISEAYESLRDPLYEGDDDVDHFVEDRREHYGESRQEHVYHEDHDASDSGSNDDFEGFEEWLAERRATRHEAKQYHHERTV